MRQLRPLSRQFPESAGPVDDESPGGSGLSMVVAAAIAALVVATMFFIGSRWFALLNRTFGVFVAWLLCGFFPAVFSAINVMVYDVAPGLFRWRNIAVIWAVAFGAMAVLHA